MWITLTVRIAHIDGPKWTDVTINFNYVKIIKYISEGTYIEMHDGSCYEVHGKPGKKIMFDMMGIKHD